MQTLLQIPHEGAITCGIGGGQPAGNGGHPTGIAGAQVHMELGVGLERNLDEGHKQEQVEQLLEVEEE